NAFSDARDERDLGVDGFDDRIGRTGRRYIDDRSVGAGGIAAFGNAGKDRQAFAGSPGPGLSTLLGVDTADHLRAVIGERLLGMERARLAGQALDEDLRVF